MKLLGLTTLYVAFGAAYVVPREGGWNHGTIDVACNFTTLHIDEDVNPILDSQCAGNDAANRIASINLDE